MLDRRQSGHLVRQRWWTCDRCGNPYPESMVVIQKGYVLCQGENSNKCVDEYGYEYFRSRISVPYEKVPQNPPTIPWEDL